MASLIWATSFWSRRDFRSGPTADAEGGRVDIHDRRPVVLSPELAREWLDPATLPERAEQIVLLLGEPAEAFAWYAVDPAVGNVRNQDAHLIEPQRSAS